MVETPSQPCPSCGAAVIKAHYTGRPTEKKGKTTRNEENYSCSTLTLTAAINADYNFGKTQALSDPENQKPLTTWREP